MLYISQNLDYIRNCTIYLGIVSCVDQRKKLGAF